MNLPIRHDVTIWLYHLGFSEKYKKAVFEVSNDYELMLLHIDIEDHYQIKFLEIGIDSELVHFLVQSVPTYSATKLLAMIKTITAKEVFKRCPQVKNNFDVVNFGVMDILRVQSVNMEVSK